MCLLVTGSGLYVWALLRRPLEIANEDLWMLRRPFLGWEVGAGVRHDIRLYRGPCFGIETAFGCHLGFNYRLSKRGHSWSLEPALGQMG